MTVRGSERPDAVLDFWFGTPGSPEYGRPRSQWFNGGDDFDALCRRELGDLSEAAAAGRLDAWAETAPGLLALIILLDQLPRNLH
ncbi:MAG: DUF924 family protein, partial [Rhodospirillales bacterium]